MATRLARLDDLIRESGAIIEAGLDQFVYRDRRELAGVVLLFSGGNDSTVLGHLTRPWTTHAAHANTGVGVEQTREFVRRVSALWGLPLLERQAPRLEDRYRALVLDRGFPGPAMHYKMFQRLKERALNQVRRELVTNGYKQRVVFLAGRRRDESARRAVVPEFERRRSTVWISPMVNWTKVDLMTYRRHHDVPRNTVADLIHMSGECLCGSFAHEGERAEIAAFYPEAFDEIAELERLLAPRTDIPEYAKAWGWGGTPELAAQAPSRLLAASRRGRLCSSCRGPDDQNQQVFHWAGA